MRRDGATNLDEPALLKCEQLFVYEREGKPNVIGQVLAGARALHVKCFEQQVTQSICL